MKYKRSYRKGQIAMEFLVCLLVFLTFIIVLSYAEGEFNAKVSNQITKTGTIYEEIYHCTAIDTTRVLKTKSVNATKTIDPTGNTCMSQTDTPVGGIQQHEYDIDKKFG